MNKVILIGNLTRDPEHTTTSSGLSMCRFSLAVSRKFTNASGEREADFINVITWRVTADNCSKYLKKGNKCAVVGTLQTRSYEQDGIKRYFTEVVAEDVEFLTSKPQGDSSETVTDSKRGKSVEEDGLEPITDDTLPF